MPNPGRIPHVLFVLFLLSLATERSLMAYADPGSGAMFVQIILAVLIGGLYRIRSVFSRLRGRRTVETVAAGFPPADAIER